MGRKLQTIYEYLHDYSEQEINDVINSLSIEEKLLIKDRYGMDLHNPKPTKNWRKEIQNQFYISLIPKIKKMLSSQREEKQDFIQILDQNESSGTISKKEEKNVTDYTVSLLQLIKQGKNNNEICAILNIDPWQLYNELLTIKNKGILYSRQYYADGTIKYNSISTITGLKNYKEIGQDRTIITDNKENNMKLLLISDLHFGNTFERVDLVDRAFDYCIKNGIHIILCGGDLIDGTYTKVTQKITDVYKQIEYFIRHYPYDKSILTFSVAGDHDMSALYSESLDIKEMCNNSRHDIIIGGYNNMAVHIKNDKLHLYHHIKSGAIRQTDAPIILHGHSHKYSTETKNNTLHITLPTLSEINQPMPSALELDISFHGGYIYKSVIKHIYFGNKDILLSEANFNLSREKIIQEEINRTAGILKNNLSTDFDTPKVCKKTM